MREGENTEAQIEINAEERPHQKTCITDPKEDEEPNREKDKYSNGMNKDVETLLVNRKNAIACQQIEEIEKRSRNREAGGQWRAEDTMYTSWEAWIRRVAERHGKHTREEVDGTGV